MKIFFSYLAATALLFTAITAHAGNIDPYWRIQREAILKKPSLNKSMGPQSVKIEVFIKSSNPELISEKIIKSGGKVKTIAGKIMTASIPDTVIEEASFWPEVEYIEAAKPIKLQNDLATADTGVTIVHSGTELPHSYDGTGVIIGTVDTGIDLTHPAFNDASGESRVLYIWDQNDKSGPGPSEISSTYGTEYKHSAIIAGTVNHRDTEGHGTHVAGTAAGLDSKYPGVAPNANLVVVRFNTVDENADSTDLCDAANYIFQKADQLRRPAVVNMSLGTHFGAHDGTSLLEQCLNELINASPGRALAAAAGNEGDTESPAYPTIDEGPGGIHARFGGPLGALAFNVYTNQELASINAWGTQDCSIDIKVGLLKNLEWIDSTSYVPNGQTEEKSLYDGATFLGTVTINRTESVNPQNGKWNTYIDILTSDDYSYTNYKMGLGIQGSCTFFDAWASSYGNMFFYGLSGDGWFPGDNKRLVGLPATAADVIAVGAYKTRDSWVSIDGNTYGTQTGLNDLAYFSSRGPAITAEQGQKPNITAPGAYIISAYSSTTEDPDVRFIVDDTHVVMQGTSMSSPHIAGIIALMLEAYPYLSNSEIISYLQNTTRTDSFVGTIPNNDWGYGKVDALAAVNAVLADHPSGIDYNDYSGIVIDGITDEETDIFVLSKTFTINFPRPFMESTITSNNLFIMPITNAVSESISKAAWDESICTSDNALPAEVSVISEQSATLTLEEPIGFGTFALCVSPLVRDSEEIKFGGKTVTFSTATGGGCQLLAYKDAKCRIGVLLLLATIISLMAASKLKQRY